MQKETTLSNQPCPLSVSKTRSGSPPRTNDSTVLESWSRALLNVTDVSNHMLLRWRTPNRSGYASELEDNFTAVMLALFCQSLAAVTTPLASGLLLPFGCLLGTANCQSVIPAQTPEQTEVPT